MKRIIFLLTIITSLIFISCTNTNLQETQTINKEVQIASKISSIDKYGNITLNITTEELLSSGFSYGDEILLVSENGYMKKAQISSKYSLEEGSTIIKTGVSSQAISASINYGNMAEEGSLTLGENIEIKLLSSNITIT
jgi:S-adenosylmethionine hydrolase